MKAFLTKLLEPLETRLDIKISVFLGEELLYPQSSRFTAVVTCTGQPWTDTEQGCVFFPFKAGGTSFLGALEGEGSERESTARVLAALLEQGGTRGESSERRLRALLAGEAGLADIVSLAGQYQGSYHVFAISCGKKHKSAVLDYLVQLAEDGDIALSYDNTTIAFLKGSASIGDYQSAREFGELISDSVSMELGAEISVGIGGEAHKIESAGQAYSEALAALRLGRLSEAASRVYSYKELVIYKLVDEIPKEKLREYFDILADNDTLQILSDREMMDTAREFLANSLNVSETARTMFLHRNTLLYRLDKIEKATGLNIRSFSDAVTFRILLTLYRRLYEGSAD